MTQSLVPTSLPQLFDQPNPPAQTAELLNPKSAESNQTQPVAIKSSFKSRHLKSNHDTTAYIQVHTNPRLRQYGNAS